MPWKAAHTNIDQAASGNPDLESKCQSQANKDQLAVYAQESSKSFQLLAADPLSLSTITPLTMKESFFISINPVLCA